MYELFGLGCLLEGHEALGKEVTTSMIFMFELMIPVVELDIDFPKMLWEFEDVEFS